MKTLAIDDLNAASAISANGVRLLSTTQDGDRTTFHFADEDGRATRASLDYINNETIPVRSFVSSYKEMRSVMYASRKGSL